MKNPLPNQEVDFNMIHNYIKIIEICIENGANISQITEGNFIKYVNIGLYEIIELINDISLEEMNKYIRELLSHESILTVLRP
jgi:hypothetical protein